MYTYVHINTSYFLIVDPRALPLCISVVCIFNRLSPRDLQSKAEYTQKYIINVITLLVFGAVLL